MLADFIIVGGLEDAWGLGAEVEIEGDGVADLTGAAGVIPIGQMAKMQLPGRAAQAPGAGAEGGREEEGGAAGGRWELLDLRR